MRVTHTIAGLQSAHGGTSRSVPALCDSLERLGHEVHLVAGRPSDPRIDCTAPSRSVRVHWINESKITGRVFTGRAFRRELAAIYDQNHANALIHDHGLWLPSNHSAAQYANLNHIPRVVSPRGMLSPWAMQHRRLKKQITMWWQQEADLRSSSAFHATSKAEANDIRRLGLSQPIAVIPNGVSLPESTCKKESGPRRRMLFLGRIHPVKGVTHLIEAYAQVGPGDDWELILVGPGDRSYLDEVKSLIDRLGLHNQVSFLGPISDREKWNLYTSADLFVMPSHTENFGIAIAEALAAGLPVLTTTGTPWSELKQRDCGWWIAPTVDGIAIALRQATTLSREELAAKGVRGSQWARTEFQWDAIGAKMSCFYHWLVQGGPQPEFVL